MEHGPGLLWPLGMSPSGVDVLRGRDRGVGLQSQRTPPAPAPWGRGAPSAGRSGCGTGAVPLAAGQGQAEPAEPLPTPARRDALRGGCGPEAAVRDSSGFPPASFVAFTPCCGGRDMGRGEGEGLAARTPPRLAEDAGALWVSAAPLQLFCQRCLLPSPSSVLLTLLPNLRIKGSAQTALSPAAHLPKDLESSFPLSLCRAWHMVPAPEEERGSHEMVSARMLELVASWSSGLIQRQWHGAVQSSFPLTPLWHCSLSVPAMELQGRWLMSENHG